MNVIDISFGQLLFSLIFVLIAGIASIRMSLDLERDIFWGTIRTFAQLFLVGYILKFVFSLNNAHVVLLIFTGMILFAAITIRGRVKERAVPYLLPTFLSMFLSYMVVTVMVTAFIVNVKPWYQPQYFIPIGGMVIGNSMTAIAITLERIFSEIRSRRNEIELYLSLGADHTEATMDITREAVRAGMIPSINSMMAVGLVFLPGMMTGQILAGVDPVISIKYQIVVMLMLVGSTAIGSIIIASIARNLCFNKAEQLRL
ncbi:MAG: iron export ABC transporter permease subunit FetB [Rubrobacteridae bacterium]|nr:iron export ABC transporter permease subunit FetB [Rubrobacteridae bacterium]